MADKYIQLQSADGVDNLYPLTGWDLLWENSAPTSSFSAQTISNLDFTPYAFYGVEYAQSYSGSALARRMVAINKVGCGGLLSQALSNNAYRAFDGTTTSVAFESANRVSTYGGTLTTYNSDLIPTRIFGIRVKVNDVR